MPALQTGSRQLRVLLWTLWLVFAAAWTAALLTALPIAARDTVLPQEYGFSAGKALHVTAYAVFAGLTSFLPLRVP